MSTTEKHAPIAHPKLFSVATDFGRIGVEYEHFMSRDARRRSLAERAEMMVHDPAAIPVEVLGDEDRLAALLELSMVSTRIRLFETEWDASGQRYHTAPCAETLRALEADDRQHAERSESS